MTAKQMAAAINAMHAKFRFDAQSREAAWDLKLALEDFLNTVEGKLDY